MGKKKIISVEDLNAIREKTRSEIDLRTGLKDLAITVHMGTCRIAAGARDVLTQFAEELNQAAIKNVTLRQTGCVGLCDQEPMVTVSDQKGNMIHYGGLNRNKVTEIVREHVVGGKPVREYIVSDERTEMK